MAADKCLLCRPLIFAGPSGFTVSGAKIVVETEGG